jgi:hypothetical protein
MILDRRLPAAVTVGPRSSKLARRRRADTLITDAIARPPRGFFSSGTS